MKSKLKFIVPILLVVLGGVYKFVLAKPGAPAPKPKVDGQVYVLPQEAVIRDIVTDRLTDDNADTLVSEKGREKLKKQLLLSIKKKTDVKVEEVLFTDVAVQ